MAQEVITSAANYVNPGLNMFTGELKIPIDNSPGGPAIGAGVIRLNSDTLVQEYWDGSAWISTSGGGSGDTISGTYTTTGDGLTSSFFWAHDLAFDPTTTGYTIDPVTASAQGIYSKSADATNFYVNCDICPIGTVTYNWTAKQP